MFSEKFSTIKAPATLRPLSNASLMAVLFGSVLTLINSAANKLSSVMLTDLLLDGELILKRSYAGEQARYDDLEDIVKLYQPIFDRGGSKAVHSRCSCCYVFGTDKSFGVIILESLAFIKYDSKVGTAILH